MFGRSLTSRLVLAIGGMTCLSALIVAVSLAWMLNRVLHMPDPGPAASFSSIALSAFMFSLVGVSVSTLIGWRLGRQITRPVLRMAGTMRRMAEGDLEVQSPQTTPATELGQMAEALETFRLNARERLEAEAGRRAAERVAQERSEFLAVMSHEIRTPMNGVLGMAEALGHSPLNDQQREMLSVLTGSGDVLLGLLNNVLDFAKMESGRLELEEEPFDVAALVRSTAELFAPEARAKGLAVEVEGAGAELWVKGDPVRVRQIVTNLISNAVKFTAAGEVRAVLSAAEQADGRRLVQIEVRDTGIGIAPDVQLKLFNKFVQGDASSTRAYGGTGLGLAISRELARKMDGDITLASRPGEGATFTVRLPLPSGRAPVELRTAKPQLAEPAPEEARALRVLAAEDNATNRQVLRIMLEMLGAEITFAHDGAEAVEAFAAADFDLVLMDLQMPVMDGLTAARRIRELEGSGPAIPMLAVSANAMPGDVAASLAAGMDGHVSKPIAPQQLFEAIEQAIGLRQGEAAPGHGQASLKVA